MCLYPVKIVPHSNDGIPRKVCTVACGRCLECLRQKSLEWSFRIMDECSLHEKNCFLTLTYNQEYLPYPPSVSRREIQLFMKRIRQELSPLKVRFFACGEYGKKNKRPHYHVILFGYFPDDAYPWCIEDGVQLYRSPTVEKVWSFGFSSVGKVTEKTALYCAKYMNKYSFEKNPAAFNAFPSDPSCPFKTYISPPFVQMSNRPGIGFDCVYKCDLNSDMLYRNGRGIKIPRYYLKVMERDGIFLDDFKAMRQANGEAVARCIDIDLKRKKFYEKFFEKKYVKTIDR
ncbi:replication initiator protein [Microvirus mar7]|uniref:Replication initiator protein n=1 Tax=Microvirus mar7 TaxID=2851203 RepID=A0A8F5MLI9_9VIRU|nr:replication initiator protein [Microvirus mar7]